LPFSMAHAALGHPPLMCGWLPISVELIFSLQAEFSPTRVSRFPSGM
jgi:hypothetical protein